MSEHAKPVIAFCTDDEEVVVGEVRNVLNLSGGTLLVVDAIDKFFGPRTFFITPSRVVDGLEELCRPLEDFL